MTTYQTSDGLRFEAETALDVVKKLRSESFQDQSLSDQAFMNLIAERVTQQQGVSVLTTSPAAFVSGLLACGLLTKGDDGR